MAARSFDDSSHPQQTGEHEGDFVTVDEAAAAMQLSTGTVARAAHNGTLPSRSSADRVLVSAAAVQMFLAARSVAFGGNSPAAA